MSNPWCCLELRYGGSIKGPSQDDISAAAAQLFDENLSGMTEADYEEHGVASLRYGYDDGPMYVLEISRSGKARWEEWADQDFDEELCPMREIQFLDRDQVVLLWTRLAQGEIAFIRSCFHAA